MCRVSPNHPQSTSYHPLARSNKQTVCLLLTVYSHPPTSYFIGYSECFPFHRFRFSDCDYIIKHICEYVNTAKHSFHLASLRGCLTFSSSQTGVSLQENTGKNRHLPVVTFYSPPPPHKPASHRRFRHQPRSHSPTHLHTTAIPNLSDFFPPRLPQNPNLSTHRFVQTHQLHTPPLVTFHKKTLPSPTLYTLHNCSTSNIFKIIMSQTLDICTPIWYNKYSKTH